MDGLFGEHLVDFGCMLHGFQGNMASSITYHKCIAFQQGFTHLMKS
jgi:hypothetical protein